MLRDAPIVAVLPAEDINRAKSFYSQKLGFMTADMSVPEDSAIFECGDGTQLYIYEREERTKAEHTAAMWMVDDIEQSVKNLRSKGVSFERYNMPHLKTNEQGIATMDGTRSAWFKDTEGNILAISEMTE